MALNINFKPCCENCGNRKTYMNEDEHSVCYDNKSVNIGVATDIGCEHEKVCKTYIESDILKAWVVPKKPEYNEDDFSMVDQLFKIEGLSADEAKRICNDSGRVVVASGVISVAALFVMVKTITHGRVDIICKPIYDDYGWCGGIDIHYSCDVCSFDTYTVKVMQKPIRL